MSTKEQSASSVPSESSEHIETDTVDSNLKDTVERKLDASAPCFTPSPGVSHSSSGTRSGSMITIPQGRNLLLSSSTDPKSKTDASGHSQRSGPWRNVNGRHDRRPAVAGQGGSRGGGGGGRRRGTGRNSSANGAVNGEDGGREVVGSDSRGDGGDGEAEGEAALGYSHDTSTRGSERKYSFENEAGSGTEKINQVLGDGASETIFEEESSQEAGGRKQQRGSKGRRRAPSGGNANHLLNFQFQPLHGHHQGTHQGTGNSEGGKSRRGNGVRRGATLVRGPLSKEQFLQANFHFLLGGQALGTGNDQSLALQEAFFDPDVLVDWDTVDTVRLWRKVRKRKLVPQIADITVAPDSRGDVSRSEEVVTDQSCQRHQARSNVRDENVAAVWGRGEPRSRVQDTELTRRSLHGDAHDAHERGGINDGDVGGDEDVWRCSICLQSPRVPRITKCGHGPFCLVCILRHLKGDGTARCPLCFEMMHRDRLRRVTCEEVVPYVSGGRATLLLLQRDRTSLVPCPVVAYEPNGHGVGDAEVSRTLEGVASRRNSTQPCPLEGDSSEKFSRLVRARPSTLRKLVAAEAATLEQFRQESLTCGETEWIPYVSLAQELVRRQLERSFSSAEHDDVGTNSVGEAREGQSRGGPISWPGSASAKRGVPEDGLVGDPRDLYGANTHEGDGSQGSGGLSKEASIVEGTAVQHKRNGDCDGENDRDASTPRDASARTGGSSVSGDFNFFQSWDGQKAFLHPLDMRQLLDDAEQGMPLPRRLDAEVLEVETVNLTPELRRRLPFLGHLPLHCDITFLELDMRGLVSESTAKNFSEETKRRVRKRRAKAAQEARTRAAEKRAEEDRTSMMAAMRALTVDLRGPRPGDPDVPPPAPVVIGASGGDGSGNLQTPSESDSTPAEPGVSSSQAPATRDAEQHEPEGVARGAGGGEEGWSFARVTAMNGHFPSLQTTGGAMNGADSASSNAGVGAWGSSSGTSGPSPIGAWGTPKRESHNATKDALGNGERSMGIGDVNEVATSGSGKRKGRKAKAVSLFSNAGVRGGR